VDKVKESFRRNWKWFALGIAIVLAASLGYRAYLHYSAPPKPYQEFVGALAEYGWQVVDLRVDTIERTIQMAAIPPEDSRMYAEGFWYILEWADPIIKPPLDENGMPVSGTSFGILFIAELDDDYYAVAPPMQIKLFGREITLLQPRAIQIYGYKHLTGMRWVVLDWLLHGDLEEGISIRSTLTTRATIHILFTGIPWWYGFSQPYENAYQPVEDGWFEIPEKEIEPRSA